MKRILSPWSKEVKKKMIDKDMDVADICERFHWSKQYVCRIINGYSYSAGAVQLISGFVGVPIPEENKTLAREANEIDE